jgi:hypothetical protein
MQDQAQKLLYGLSIFIFMTALFVMQPSRVPATGLLQDHIKNQFTQAWKQTIGDQPYFDSLAVIFDGVNSFYNQSAQAAIHMVGHPDSDRALAYIFKTMYLDVALAVRGDHVAQAAMAEETVSQSTFMTQTAISNIIPEVMNHESGIRNQGQVAGMTIDSTPVNAQNPWVTLQDNFTGQVYCLAVYNGEVNKYLGPCKNDYR